MNSAAIIAAVREMLIIALMLVSPFLLAAVLASFVIGIVQACTRINDLTLSFIPRFAAVLLVLYFASTWAAGEMTAHIERSAIGMRAILE
jgi:flagellar biosynthesis protein FliQ